MRFLYFLSPRPICYPSHLCFALLLSKKLNIIEQSLVGRSGGLHLNTLIETVLLHAILFSAFNTRRLQVSRIPNSAGGKEDESTDGLMDGFYLGKCWTDSMVKLCHPRQTNSPPARFSPSLPLSPTFLFLPPQFDNSTMSLGIETAPKTPQSRLLHRPFHLI